MATIINLEPSEDAVGAEDFVMVGLTPEGAAKTIGRAAHGEHLADAERLDSEWFSSFEDAMKLARLWAAERGVEIIYVKKGISRDASQ
jgi:hypothetical protein